MSVGRSGCRGCDVLSDGRFAVLGGHGTGAYTSSCEALTLGKHAIPQEQKVGDGDEFDCLEKLRLH